MCVTEEIAYLTKYFSVSSLFSFVTVISTTPVYPGVRKVHVLPRVVVR